MELKVTDIREPNNPTSIVKAFININYHGLIIKGLRIIDGRNGKFVSYPREKGKDDKWYDIVIPDNMTLKQEIENIVMDEYGKHFLSKVE